MWGRSSIQPSRARAGSGTSLARWAWWFAADCHVRDSADEDILGIGRYIMRYLIMLVLLGGVYATTVGCEAKVDDDGDAKVKVGD